MVIERSKYLRIVDRIEQPTGKPHKVLLMRFLIANANNPSVMRSDFGFIYNKCDELYTDFASQVLEIETLNKAKPTIREPFHAIFHSCFEGEVRDKDGRLIRSKKDIHKDSGIVGYLPEEFVISIQRDPIFAAELMGILDVKISEMKHGSTDTPLPKVAGLSSHGQNGSHQFQDACETANRPVEPSPGWFAKRFAKFRGAITDAPADLAAQHDHYLYGTPKR